MLNERWNNMIKRQVVTNKTDAVIAVVVTDAKGYMGAPLQQGQTPSFVGEVKIRLAVGREQWDSYYQHRTAQGSVVKDDWVELGSVPLRYVTETIGGTTVYRLPRLTDSVNVNELPLGEFACFKVKVPRGTFDVTGTMKVAICNMVYNVNEAVFEDHTQEVWSKMGDTNIVVSGI